MPRAIAVEAVGGSTGRAENSDLTPCGKMTDTTLLSSRIPTDTITLTSQSRSTRTSSEVLREPPNRRRKSISLSTSLENRRPPKTGLLNKGKSHPLPPKLLITNTEIIVVIDD
jgi:hypothetical protein